MPKLYHMELLPRRSNIRGSSPKFAPRLGDFLSSGVAFDQGGDCSFQYHVRSPTVQSSIVTLQIRCTTGLGVWYVTLSVPDWNRHDMGNH